MDLKYCCYNKKAGCYIEFQKGDFTLHDCFWLSDSLYLDDDIANACGLYTIFSKTLPRYDCYCDTKVTKSQWENVKNCRDKSSKLTWEIIDEIDAWAQECFLCNDCFTILGV